MQKSKAASPATSVPTFKSGKGRTGPEAASVAGKSKPATNRRVHSEKAHHPVQLTIFDYAAAIGVTLLPEAS